MKLTVISSDKRKIDSIKKYCSTQHKKQRIPLELAAFDAVLVQDEAIMLKMYEAIEAADICILDIDDYIEYPLLFNIVYTCRLCKGHIIPSNYKSGICNLLRLGMLTIEDITRFNPQMDIDSNYLSMVRNIQDFERYGVALAGRFRDFRNYVLICKYIKARDRKSVKDLLMLLMEEYGEIPCSCRHIS